MKICWDLLLIELNGIELGNQSRLLFQFKTEKVEWAHAFQTHSLEGTLTGKENLCLSYRLYKTDSELKKKKKVQPLLVYDVDVVHM